MKNQKRHYIKAYAILAAACLTVAWGCQPISSIDRAGSGSTKGGAMTTRYGNGAPGSKELKQATFGAGCFWCVEAVFQRLKGVDKVLSGYSGGHVDRPTYEQVCTGATGHAEVCQILYDPAIISFDELLEVFWKTHDPTTLNRQGNDVGTQYRSAIFYHDEEQKKLAESYKRKLDAEHIWDHPIVTEIVPYQKFWPAEDYHQNYYNANSGRSYCQLVINPKLAKLKKVFADKLKQLK